MERRERESSGAIKDHSEKSEHHRTMATKAQGAIEVGDQIYLEEESSEG